MTSLSTLFPWLPKLQRLLKHPAAIRTSLPVRQDASFSQLSPHSASQGLFPWRRTTDQTASAPDPLQLGQSLATAYGLAPASQQGASLGEQCESQSHRLSSLVIHIVGKQGVGKSTLARDIKTGYAARGVTCKNLTEMGMHEPGMDTNIQHIREHGYREPYSTTFTHPDVLIVEHLYTPHPEQTLPGDLLIRLERAQ